MAVTDEFLFDCPRFARVLKATFESFNVPDFLEFSRQWSDK
jgi:hypothetical protein